MSLSISLTPDQVEERLARLGAPCRFTAEERLAFQTTPVVQGPDRFLAFPTPAENAGLTLRKIKAAVGVDPAKQPSFFDHPWYDPEPFLDVSCPAGWHFITMEPLSGSIRQPLAY